MINSEFQVEEIAHSPNIILALNKQLHNLGLLDPEFVVNIKDKPGPTSNPSLRWTLDSITALNRWLVLNKQISLKDYDLFDIATVKEFFAEKPAELYPADIYPNTMLAFSVAQRMLREGFYINRGLGINTAYLEGVSIDGIVNADRPNEWNDLCIWFTVAPNGCLRFIDKAVCTTEPGKYYTVNPLNNNGAARIAFGQYKAWVNGLHKGIQPALVQAGKLKVHRDKDRSMTRSKKDIIEIVSAAGINQHSTGPRVKPALVGKYSAGCLVKEDYEMHMLWYNQSLQDYRQLGNAAYLHIATVMAGPI